jgi:hypothetical protein
MPDGGGAGKRVTNVERALMPRVKVVVCVAFNASS